MELLVLDFEMCPKLWETFEGMYEIPFGKSYKYNFEKFAKIVIKSKGQAKQFYDFVS